MQAAVCIFKKGGNICAPGACDEERDGHGVALQERPLAAALGSGSGSGSGGVRVVRTGDDDVLGVGKGGDVRAHDEGVHLAADVLAAHAHRGLVARQHADGDGVERHRMNRSFVVAEIHAAAASAPRDTGRAQGRMPRLHRVPRADAEV
jgi:hypothetical protein